MNKSITTKPKGFEVPYVVGGWFTSENNGAPCACNFSCGSGYEGCADSFDPSCGWSLAFGVFGIVIAIIPSNAVPG